MRIIADNLVDIATLSASPAMVATLPVTNLQTQPREEVARTTSLAAQTIDVTLPSARLMSGIVLYRGNFSAAATWRVKIYLDASMGVLLYDSGDSFLSAPKTLGDLNWGIDPLGITLFTGWGYTFAAIWFAPVAGAFVRITLNDASNPAGYMQASRLFLGTYIEPRGMPQRGVTLTWKDTTTQQRTDGGTLRSEAGTTYRALDIDGALMPEADRILLATMLRDQGMRSDVYVSLFPGLGNALERDHQMQCKLVAIRGSSLPLYGYVNQQLNFEEI